MKKKVLVISSVIAVAVVGFLTWFFIAQPFKVETAESEPSSEPTTVTEDRIIAYVNKDATLSDIVKADGAVNVYIFWGNGCPHCKNEWEYIESIRKEYPNEFRAYGFEVWYNHENNEILKKFSMAVGDNEVNSVPYIIIGNKSYHGTTINEKFLEAIKEAKKQNFDVYFDVVK